MDASLVGDTPIYREVQRFNQWWAWAMTAALAGGAWYLFMSQIVRGIPVGSRPAPDGVVWILWSLLGIVVPLLHFACRLIVEVRPAAMVITYVPFLRKRVPLDEVETAEAVQYHPIREYGGWGIRWAPKRGFAYTVGGDRGVRVARRRGAPLLLGSRHPDALVEALETARSL